MKVVILGAGVAGLCSGIALIQRGFNVEIFERTASPATIGAGVVLWPNATLVLEQLGLLPRIKNLSGAPNQMRRVTSSGQALGTLDIEMINKQIGGASLSISRSALIDVLYHAFLEVGGSIHFSQEVAELTSKSGEKKASIRFRSGLVLAPEIIIGAEGRMNSPSRQYVLEHNTPVFQKFINWVGIIETEKSDIDNKVIFDFWGVGARFGIVPLSPQSAYWAAGVTANQIGANEPENYKDEMLAVFNAWPTQVSDLIRDTPTHKINKIFVHDHDPVETWHRNNLILIGDAAHAPLPTSGQGACQAIEDAWHIARALDQGGRDTLEAFQNFTSTRRARTAGITMAGRLFAQTVFNDDPEFCRARDEASKSADFSNLAKAMAGGWANPFGNLQAMEA